MPMVTSQILKSVDFTKTQKCRHLENETLFFLQIKKIYRLHIKAFFTAKNSFIVGVTFKLHQAPLDQCLIIGIQDKT